MIRSLSFAIPRWNSVQPISQISRNILKLHGSVQHVAQITSTCIKHSDATPSNTHGSKTKFTLNIKLPDLAISPEQPGPDLPFLPDFWDSSLTRGANSIRHDVVHEAPMRPILVVAGISSQQAAGGPTYDGDHSSPTLEHATTRTQPVTSSPPTGFWADFIDDLGIPTDYHISNPLKQSRDISSSEQPLSNRPLNDEEKRGLWALLLFISGSYIMGGLFSKPKRNSGETR
ncbi:hypothetical protein Clacol_006345 [Clathrus columnatus]|uniref:Uncharacterized protein n=1 Tax=Clathrus columnatus TaxID=1419009 RepID=A0AAV5ABV2_9AGAM|nr:hypothetical protein Clacol_006345 [Clathrus columnatus]